MEGGRVDVEGTAVLSNKSDSLLSFDRNTTSASNVVNSISFKGWALLSKVRDGTAYSASAQNGELVATIPVYLSGSQVDSIKYYVAKNAANAMGRYKWHDGSTGTSSYNVAFPNTRVEVEANDSTGGGSESFIGLTDTPSAYTGEGGKLVGVNAGATALEFVNAPSGTFSGLTDTPSSYTGNAGKIPQVNAGETALEYLTPPMSVAGRVGGKGRKIATSGNLPAQVIAAGTTINMTWVIESAFTSEYSTSGGRLFVPRCVDHPGWFIDVMVGSEAASCSWVPSNALEPTNNQSYAGANFQQVYRLGCTVYGGTAGNRAINMRFQRQQTSSHLDAFDFYGGGQAAILANTKVVIYEWSPGQGSVVTEISQAAFDLLSSPDDNTLYAITS